MNTENYNNNRRSSPIMIAIVIILVGTLANLLLMAQYAGPMTISDGFVEAQGDMGFVKWSSEHQMAEIEPNTLFAVVNGKFFGRFQFQSDSYNALSSAGVSDNAQRTWVNVDHSEGTYHVNRYPKSDSDILTEPIMTFVDTDGDGLIDRKVDWVAKKTYNATGSVEWNLYVAPTKSDEP
jgi:hypothetical protein